MRGDDVKVLSLNAPHERLELNTKCDEVRAFASDRNK